MIEDPDTSQWSIFPSAEQRRAVVQRAMAELDLPVLTFRWFDWLVRAETGDYRIPIRIVDNPYLLEWMQPHWRPQLAITS